ncbi:efflux RND transporter periplasmic adaptor subunit [bacterium]|nr:efflux RND transporter periplasmic adaptor subunit [bacterium]
MLRHVNTPLCTLVVLALAAIGSGGCGDAADDGTAAEVARNVRVMPLETAPITQYFELAGPVVPVRGADIAAEEAGTVDRIDHDKGERVEPDAPLVTLDRRLLAAELDAAQAQLELQAYDHEKKEQLHAAGKISELELLRSAAQLAEARSRRDVARTRHQRAQVRAPYAGIVAERYVEPGELVAPGTRIARVIDPYVLKLDGGLTEREVAWMRPGMSAEVALEGLAEPRRGTVAWVGFEASMSNGKFPVEIHVPNEDLQLRSGAIGRARVARGTTDGMVVIPRDAVMPGDGIDFVFVVDRDRARKRIVELGPGQGLMVAVRQGLEPGELLVVRGQRDLQDGNLVSINERVAYGDGTAPDDPDVIRAESASTRVAGEAVR